MKLKLVAVSMSLAGLISAPLFAATNMHKTNHTTFSEHGLAKLPMQLSSPCTITQTEIIMDLTTQNEGRSLPKPCLVTTWIDHLQWSGGVNVDLGKFGSRNANYMGENYQRAALNDVYLNLGADINSWIKAFASISFGTPTTQADNGGAYPAEYSAAYSNNIQGNGANNVQIEQAYAVFSNFNVMPFFAQVGKGFQDFGRYQTHPITRSMTQVMSETLATSFKLGFVVPMGLHGSASVFDDPTGKIGKTTPTTNYILALGYDHIDRTLGYDLGVSYIANLYGVNDVAYLVNNFTANTNYNQRAGGVALYGDINSGPFRFGARYTTAVQRFSQSDLPQFGLATSTKGAKPWAADVFADFTFYNFFGKWHKKQNLMVGYQTSREAAGLNLPRNRFEAAYSIDPCKNTSLALQWDHDQAYSLGTGGSGNSTNLVSVRVAVQFA